MDEHDRKILEILQVDDKISYKDLADRLGLAASTVHSRVRKLVEDGTIKSFSAILDYHKVGYRTVALLGLTVDPLKMSKVAKKLASYNQIQLVATSTGDHDVVVKLFAKDDKALWRFINENVKTIDGVGQMDVSSFIDIYKMTHLVEFDDSI